MKTNKTIFFIVLLFAGTGILTLPAQTLDYLDYDDPAYELLERVYVNGLVEYLPQVRPLMKKQALEILEEARSELRVRENAKTGSLEEQLEETIERLSGKIFHLLDTGEGKTSRGTLDFGFAARVDSALNRPADTVPIFEQNFRAGLSVTDRLYIDLVHADYITLEPYEKSPYRKFYDAPLYPDYNLYTWHLDRDEKAFNFNAIHYPGENDLSLRVNSTTQLSLDLTYVYLHAGRETLSWGPSMFANLALSKTAKPYEYLRFDIPFAGKGMFTWMTGFLENRITSKSTAIDEERKLITAHRVEFQFFPWFMFALYESVIYSYRFEFGYINPFSIYYASEVRLGDYDNKLGGADFIFRIPKAKMYLSLFADDWDFAYAFDFGYFHNELGALAGVELYDLLPDFSLKAEYAYMSHWMYTHRSDIEGHATNNYTHFGHHLGHPLEQNSHMFQMELAYSPAVEWRTGITFWLMEDSWGDIEKPPLEPGMDKYNWDLNGKYEDWDDYYNFLDYGIDGITREINFDIGVFGEYYVPFVGVKIHADLAYAFTWNLNKVEGQNAGDLFFTISAQWQGY
jgi:hypothetical protein